MKYYIYFFILYFYIQKYQAQSYQGYMGKRNLINLNYNLGLSEVPQNNLQKFYAITHVVNKIDVEVERSVASHSSFGVNLKYMRCLFNTNKIRSLIYDLNNNSSSSHFAGIARINQVALGLHYKYFINKKGSFAPIGKYVLVGLNYNKMLVGKNDLYYLENTSPLAKKIDQFDNGGYLAFLIAFGNHKVFKYHDKTYIFHAAFSCNWGAGMFNTNKASDSEFNPDQKFIAYLTALDLFGAKFGIGRLF